MKNTRRELLSGALAVTSGAAPFAVTPVASQALNSGAAMAYPQSEAEGTANIEPVAAQFPPGDVRRYGVLANDQRVAAANTRALKALVTPAGTFSGKIWFPNVTGADRYHFNDVIPFHDDIQMDLQGSTLAFKKDAVAADVNSGFIFAIRNFCIENGSISVDYSINPIASSAGSAIHIGNRGSDSIYFSPAYDSLLKSPMGNIVIRNLRITSAVAGGNAIEMTGGLAGVVVENVWIDGRATLHGGIYYEFGWATSGTTDQRQTSHGHNMRFINVNVSNLQMHTGVAVTLAGAYNCLIEGLYVSGAASVFNGTSGESLFYRPWAGVDEVGAKRTIVLRNVIAHSISGTAVTLGGAQRAIGGYLEASNIPPASQTDLGDYSLDGFALQGVKGGWGVFTSAGRADIRNGRISGFQRGIVGSNDCTRLLINAVDVFECAQVGLQLDIDAGIWNPPRQKMGEIRNCFIAGNSNERPGIYPAITLNNCAGFLIENNRIGYEAEHDGMTERTQGNAVQLGARCSNVICCDNYVGGAHGDSVAYYNVTNKDARGNVIQNPGGLLTSHGSWEGRTTGRRDIAFTSSIKFDATGSENFDITATSAMEFTVNEPSNAVFDKVITITIHNASSGALGRVTWNSVFKMSPWISPASGHSRSIVFRCYEGKWVQVVQGSADVPN